MAVESKKGRGRKKVASKKIQEDNADLFDIVEEEIVFKCPKRGLIKQKVKVKKFKAPSFKSLNTISVKHPSIIIEDIDDKLKPEDQDDEDSLSDID